ncbi:MAG: mechanosensitive ion channel family protein [Candidatus Izimaplasma sp.]|nr:mechanosensitive ion channel family protein [Candidatus Izimaplasma bacterium]
MIAFLFSLPINIIITVALVGFLIGLYYVVNKLLIGKKEKINKYLVLFLYLLLFIIFVFALVFGLYIWEFDFQPYLDDIQDKIATNLLRHIGSIITTVLIIFATGFIVKILKFIILRSSSYVKTSNEKRKTTIMKVTMSIINYIIKLIALLLILSVWGVNVLPALAGLGILGLVVGLGAQSLIQDIIAGFFIVFEKHFDIGDMVEINGFKGEVIDIGLKTTRVKNWKQDVKIFNNGSVQNAINYSLTQSLAIVEFGIAYGEDVDKTLEILTAELPKTKETIPDIVDDPVCVGVVALADSSVNLRVVAKTKTEAHYGVERALRKEIKKILDSHGIEIPFPQVVVNKPKEQ